MTFIRETRLLIALFSSAALLAPAGLSDSKLEVKDLQNHPFAVDFPSGNRLRMHLRSGEFHIVGRAQDKITVRVEGKNAYRAQDFTVRFWRSENEGELRLSGGPKNDLRVTIEIPKAAMLFVRMPAGELHVEGVSGDKDVELHAGELTIDVGAAAEYAHVDASVMSGELDGAPFNEYHGGLFRSFQKSGAGKYKLHAHVGAGQLTLQ
jgi:hypothetical protein